MHSSRVSEMSVMAISRQEVLKLFPRPNYGGLAFVPASLPAVQLSTLAASGSALRGHSIDLGYKRFGVQTSHSAPESLQFPF